MGNKPVKNENKKNLETYSQGKDTLKYLKINPPKLPNIYNHDYDLKNVDIMSNNETYGKITKGTIPVVFFGHLMSENKKSLKRLSTTQRNKKKLLTIIYYTPWFCFFVFIAVFELFCIFISFQAYKQSKQEYRIKFGYAEGENIGGGNNIENMMYKSIAGLPVFKKINGEIFDKDTIYKDIMKENMDTFRYQKNNFLNHTGNNIMNTDPTNVSNLADLSNNYGINKNGLLTNQTKKKRKCLC